MKGIIIDGPTHVYGDNMSIIRIISKPESNLNKTSGVVFFYRVREAVAIRETLLEHKPVQQTSRLNDKSIGWKKTSISYPQSLAKNLW